MTNYQSALERIRAAKSNQQLERVEKGLCRVYEAGQLTGRELARLMVKIMEKAVQLPACDACGGYKGLVRRDEHVVLCTSCIKEIYQ